MGARTRPRTAAVPAPAPHTSSSETQRQAETADIAPERILQVSFGFWGSMALLSAVELGLFTELGSGALDRATLEKRLALHPVGSRVTVQSDNPAYPDWPDCSLADIHCVGRVIWAGRRID